MMPKSQRVIFQNLLQLTAKNPKVAAKGRSQAAAKETGVLQNRVRNPRQSQVHLLAHMIVRRGRHLALLRQQQQQSACLET